MSVPLGDTAVPNVTQLPAILHHPTNCSATTSLLQLQHTDLLMLMVPSKENEECYLCPDPTDVRGNPCLDFPQAPLWFGGKDSKRSISTGI